jgi:hypothetical protein
MSSLMHHLVTLARPWSATLTVLGIFASREDAERAVSEAQQDGPTPDRYSIEAWRNDERLG